MSAIGDFLRGHPAFVGLSLRTVEDATGVSRASIGKIWGGSQIPDDATLGKFVAAILQAERAARKQQVDRPATDPEQLLQRLRNVAEQDRLGPFELPPEADLLGRRERALITDMVWHVIRSTKRESSEGASTDAPAVPGNLHVLRPMPGNSEQRITHAAYNPDDETPAR
ncbi:hypothetical protein [Actinosynnema sp. NPDC023587]|uniref:hypothetical protein n=1 Tax=Actinosynnema sp. NPDC023587 TaxID=3154695 RepID=UPI0033E84E34